MSDPIPPVTPYHPTPYHPELLLSRKFYKVGSAIVGAMTVIAGVILFFMKTAIDQNALALGVIVVGIVILALALIINSGQRKETT